MWLCIGLGLPGPFDFAIWRQRIGDARRRSVSTSGSPTHGTPGQHEGLCVAPWPTGSPNAAKSGRVDGVACGCGCSVGGAGRWCSKGTYCISIVFDFCRSRAFFSPLSATLPSPCFLQSNFSRCILTTCFPPLFGSTSGPFINCGLFRNNQRNKQVKQGPVKNINKKITFFLSRCSRNTHGNTTAEPCTLPHSRATGRIRTALPCHHR